MRQACLLQQIAAVSAEQNYLFPVSFWPVLRLSACSGAILRAEWPPEHNRIELRYNMLRQMVTTRTNFGTGNARVGSAEDFGKICSYANFFGKPIVSFSVLTD
jgi:hypothetical protein